MCVTAGSILTELGGFVWAGGRVLRRIHHDVIQLPGDAYDVACRSKCPFCTEKDGWIANSPLLVRILLSLSLSLT